MGVLKVKTAPGVWTPVSQGWSPLSGGYVGHASPSVDQSGIGATMTDITNMSVTWNADPTRRYKTTMILTCYPTTGPASVVAQIANASNALIRRSFVTVPTANYYTEIAVVAVETGLSGAQTRKAQINTSAGTLTLYAAATTAVIVVEDITTVTPGPTNPAPGGYVTHAEVSANQTIPGGYAVTTVTGLSKTITLDATRRYRVSAFVAVKKDTQAGDFWVMIVDNGTPMVQAGYTGAINDLISASPFKVVTGLSGSHTFDVRISSSTNNVTTQASANAVLSLLIEDIGGT